MDEKTEKYYPVDHTIYGSGREDAFIFRKNDGRVNWTSRADSQILAMLNGLKSKEHFFQILQESDLVTEGSLPLDLVEKRLDNLIKLGLLRRETALSGVKGSSPPNLHDFLGKKNDSPVQKAGENFDIQKTKTAARKIGLSEESVNFIFNSSDENNTGSENNRRIISAPQGKHLLFTDAFYKRLYLPKTSLADCLVQESVQEGFSLLDDSGENSLESLMQDTDFDGEGFFGALLDSELNNKWVLDAVMRDISRKIEEGVAYIGAVSCGIAGTPYFKRSRDISGLRFASRDNNIFHSESSYNEFKNNPRIAAYPEAITVSMGLSISDTFFMLNGRSIIPPFYPVGSTSNTALSMLFRYINSDCYYCSAPLAAYREAPHDPNWAKNTLTIDEGGFNTTIAMDICRALITDDPLHRIREAGRRYRERAALSPKLFGEYYNNLANDMCIGNINSNRAIINMYNGEPSFWRHDVEAGIELWEDLLNEKKKEAPPKLQQHLALFGEALEAWVELREELAD
ncbi:MAG: hypothetical protein LBV52_06635 [Spirochaetaceae bacterium]|jgi:hypothetical protein|nr:hypothetical protein [Spirochaetaceae bacterium]